MNDILTQIEKQQNIEQVDRKKIRSLL